MNRRLKQVFDIETGEEIIFSDGDLTVENDGYSIFWHLELYEVENGKSLKGAIRDKKQLKLRFISENDEEYLGQVIVKKYTPEYIEVVGNGKLTGYN